MGARPHRLVPGVLAGAFSAARRGEGAAADPDAPRGRPLRAEADALYDSSRVPHDSRWDLPLPDAQALPDELVNAVSLIGTEEEVAERLARFRENNIDRLIVTPVHPEVDQMKHTVERLAALTQG